MSLSFFNVFLKKDMEKEKNARHALIQVKSLGIFLLLLLIYTSIYTTYISIQTFILKTSFYALCTVILCMNFENLLITSFYALCTTILCIIFENILITSDGSIMYKYYQPTTPPSPILVTCKVCFLRHKVPFFLSCEQYYSAS